MRNLTIQATDWVSCLPDASCELPNQERLLTLECARSDQFYYQRLALTRGAEVFWYLYAWNEDASWVLGVFDTAGQADFFLALHTDNPLKVPALELPRSGPPVTVADETLVYADYAGVYRVGFKSYRVETDKLDPELRSMHYVEGYNSQFLGVASEKEACLAIYSHFDARLRGCKMC
jgi:hypothetical protein